MRVSRYIILCVLMAITWGCAETQEVASVQYNSTDIKVNLDHRTFDMGFVPVPRKLTAESFMDAFKIISSAGEAVLFQDEVPWSDFLTGEVNFNSKYFEDMDGKVANLAKKIGLKPFICLDPLASDGRSAISGLPKELKGKTFQDEELRRIFRRAARTLAERYQPKYMSLASEFNTYYTHHPEELDAFVQLYSECYDDIKEVSPDTMVFVTFQYEDLQGLWGEKGIASKASRHEPHWFLFDAFGDKLDAVAITSYPGIIFKSSFEMPDDYYAKVRSHTQKPIIVAEMGWATARPYSPSPREQALFLARFAEMTKDLELRLVIWWFLHDWKGPGYPDFAKTMGLIDTNGQKKESWFVWQQIHDAMLVKPTE